MDQQNYGTGLRFLGTVGLWIIGRMMVVVPTWQDAANMATVFAGLATGCVAVYNLIKKKKNDTTGSK